jgi:hypothetical protein
MQKEFIAQWHGQMGKPREIIWKYMKMLVNQYLLVGGLEHGFHFSIYWECHDPN